MLPGGGRQWIEAIWGADLANLYAVGWDNTILKYQPGSDSWIAIAAGNSAVVDQTLGGNWNTEQLVPGDYSLRLVVYDSQNNTLPSCTITVRVTATEE